MENPLRSVNVPNAPKTPPREVIRLKMTIWDMPFLFEIETVHDTALGGCAHSRTVTAIWADSLEIWQIFNSLDEAINAIENAMLHDGGIFMR